MKLTDVISSHVKAVGFIPDVEVLLVLFKDGTLSARTGVSVDRYVALLESASKGSFLAAMTEQSVRIIKGGNHVAAGNAGDAGKGLVANQPNVESQSGRSPGAPVLANSRLTVNEMLKVKGSDPSAGCDFAVIGGR